MTPKEKAKELVMKYCNAPITINGKHANYNGLIYKHAKQCALIAVDEMLDIFNQYNGMYEQFIFDAEVLYWEQVQEEIEKL
jgi:hypothetical protein